MAGAPEITVGTAPELSSGTSANRRREAVAGGYPTTRTCQGINRPSRSGSLRVAHRPTPHLVRRGHPFVREVEHHAVRRVEQVVAVVHPDPRVVGPERDLPHLAFADLERVHPQWTAGDRLPVA